MVKRYSLPFSFSTTSLQKSLSSNIISLQQFPLELLLIIFQDFDIPMLLNLCNICKAFQKVGTEVLSRKFKEPNVGLTLTFEQEHKWKFIIPFELSKFNRETGNFIFKPRSKQQMRFINSSMIRSPVLSKISITGLNNEVESRNNSEINLPSIVNIPPPPPLPINGNINSTSSSKISKNFLHNSLSLNIKSQKETLKKVRYAYRIGHGTSHLRIPYAFTYSVDDNPPPLIQKTRGGERWLSPISLECAPSFFYPREPTAHKIIMNIIDLKKRNKRSSLPSTPSVINFEEEDVESGFVSIEVMKDQDQENLVNNNDNDDDITITRDRRSTRFQQMNTSYSFMQSKSRKHKRGARS